MKFLSICFLTLMMLGFSGVNADDWKQFRGNARDGKSLETGVSDWKSHPPKLQATWTGVGQGYSSLCVVDDKVYTTGNSEASQFVVCLDFTTGDVLWRTDIVDVLPNHAVAGSRSTPTFDDGKLYVVSSDGRIVCLDTAQKGKIVWQKSFQKDFNGRLMSGWGFSESPLVDEEKVIVTPGGSEAMVVALNKSNGETLWKCQLDESRRPRNALGDELRFGAGYSSVIKVETSDLNSHYVAFVGSGLIGIDSQTGKILWQQTSAANKTANICMPVYRSNKVAFSSSPRGATTILNLKKKGDVFQTELVARLPSSKFCCHHGGMILHDDFLFFASGETKGLPTCLDFKTGRKKWGASFRGPGSGPASVIYIDQKIIFRYQNGMVAMIAANGNKYQPLGHFRQKLKSENKSWAYPVVVDKKLLLRENDAIMVYQLD